MSITEVSNKWLTTIGIYVKIIENLLLLSSIRAYQMEYILIIELSKNLCQFANVMISDQGAHS
jgi:hypothetical protein